MSIPLRNLPLVQNWGCHNCTDCCRLEAVVTEAEKQRIEALALANDAEVAPQPWFSAVGDGKHWTLNHRADGSCVFLTAANRCRLQERFGPDAKPFVCRLFPFVLIPAGNHWRVGMRYSCPSAAANQGRPLKESEKELNRLVLLLEQHVGRSADAAPAPALQAGQQLSWPDLCRIVEVLIEMMQDRRDRLERRLRKCLAVARVCSQTKLHELGGKQLSEYVQAVRVAVDAEVPRTAAELPQPDLLIGRILFRALLAIFARRDRVHRSVGIGGRLARVRAAWRFVRGSGAVPRVNPFLPEATFEAVERDSGTPLEIEETLERYYVVKLTSLQFCGPPNFGLPFWAGLESLILTLPMIQWLRRAFADVPPVQAVQQAIQIVDDHFGGDPMLGFAYVRFLQGLIAQHGELEKLVAWYSR